MIRAQALQQSGLYRQAWFPAEDRDLWIRVMERWHGANHPRALHRKREHPRSICSQNARLQSQLVLRSTVDALERRQAPSDVSRSVSRAAWVRGALFAAFGLAARGTAQEVVYYLTEALRLDAQVARESFGELLGDRIAAYMYHHDAHVAAGMALVDRIFAVLPEGLSQVAPRPAPFRAQVFAIAAFCLSDQGRTRRARQAARMALVRHRDQWRNRGLIKIALGFR
jgi:hypothetical protein